jgi:periplasmic protein TonB
LLQTAHHHEGLEFSDFCEAVEDHGPGYLGQRSLSRRGRTLPSILLSLFFHVAVLSAFVLIPGMMVKEKNPWIDVRLVSLGSGEVATGGAGGGGSGGPPAAPCPTPESLLSKEALPPQETRTATEEAKEKDPKPTVKEVPTQPRPVSKSREPTKSLAPQREPCLIEASSAPAPDSARDSVEPSTVNAGSAQGFAASGEGGSGGGGTGPGAGPGRGHGGGGPVDAEFGAANGPQFARKVMPKYPSLARQSGKEAIVVLRVTIDEGGRPIAVEALKTAGPGFDEEAIRAVKDSLFHPAKREGKPVMCRAILPIRFELRNSE